MNLNIAIMFKQRSFPLLRRGLGRGVLLVPKARPEYSEGHAQEEQCPPALPPTS